MAIQTQAYPEFETWLKEKLGESRVPITGMMELTPRCNFNCAHCYMGTMRDGEPGMDTAFVCQILQQIADAGCFALSFTGGEPLLRKDYREIHRVAHQLGFWINLMTNGSLITTDHIAFLKEHPPRAVEVSLYGGNEESYAAVTGVRGAFARVTRNIDAMQNAGLNIILKSVLLQPVWDSIPAMNAFAAARGLEILFDAGVTPDLQSDFSPTLLRLAPACAVDAELDSQIKQKLLAEYHQRNVDGDKKPGFVCGAGQRGFHVDCTGNLLGCLMLREPAFSLRQHSFAEAWQKLGAAGPPRFPENARCNTCDVQHLCGFCPGTVACGEAPPTHEESFYCRVARFRLEKLQK